MIRKALGLALAAGLLAGCVSAPPKSEFIGIARMLPNRAVEQQLVAQGGREALGELRMVMKPGDAAYAETLAWLGGLQPGEIKGVPAASAR